MSCVSAESYVEQGGKGYVSVFLAAGAIPASLPLGQCRLIGRQFLPMPLSLPGFRIGMIISLCHISGICPVEIDRLKMLVRRLMAARASFLWWWVLIPSGPIAVDDLTNRIASFVSAGVKDGVLVNGS